MLSSSLSLTKTIGHPKIGVGCIVLREGKILLGKRKGPPSAGHWGLPGGGLEFGESVESCAIRELFQETGLKAVSLRLGPWVENMMETDQSHYISLFVLVDECVGEPALLEPDKCEGWEWFPFNDLPEPLFSPIPSLIKKEPDLIRSFLSPLV